MLKNKIKEEALSILNKNKYSESFWDGVRRSVVKKIIDNDISDFVTWDEIRRTMYVSSDNDYIRKEYEHIKDSMYRKNLTSNNLKHTNVYGNLCTNTTHMLYHIQKFKDITGVSIESCGSVIEFGGGFGNMCKVINNQNKDISYTIFDFEEFSLLQKYYLEENSVYGVKFINNLDELCGKKFDTLIATWSLSESPSEIRELFLKNIEVSNFLIAYQSSFEGIDNNNFFKYLSNKIENVKWYNVPIDHIPNQNYLFGIKR